MSRTHSIPQAVYIACISLFPHKAIVHRQGSGTRAVPSEELPLFQFLLKSVPQPLMQTLWVSEYVN